VGLVRDHFGAPVFEVLDPPDLDRRRVDIDPVVGKHVLSVDDQDHGQKVTESERAGGVEHVAGR